MKKIIFALLLSLFCFPALAADKESAFDRMMRTNVLRCGYYVFPPVTLRDAKTDALSGLAVDIINRIGEKAGIKIEWTEEVTFGNWVPALQANRFDAVCTPMWPDIPTARAALFSEPMFFAGLYPLVRADDARFKDAGIDRLNQPDVKWITHEGNATDALTREVFAKAEITTMPSSMDGPTTLQEIVTKKADAILADHNAMIEYNKNNPVRLRLITKDGPVKAQPFTLVVARGQGELQDYLNNALRDMHNDGSLDRLLAKWESQPGLFLRAAKSYDAPQ